MSRSTHSQLGTVMLLCAFLCALAGRHVLASETQRASFKESDSRSDSQVQGIAEQDGKDAKKKRKQEAAGWVERPDKRWRSGPVRYIITRNEDKAYKKLRTEEQRTLFIERFWRRRDPTPETLFNEFRAQFFRRVAQTKHLFQDSPYPGWRTDRGKMYVLLGPPDDIISDSMARGHRGTILWTYRNRFREDLDPQIIIAFARDTSGDFIMTVRPTEVADVNRGLAPHQPNIGREAWLFGPDPQNNPLSSQYRGRAGTLDPLLRSRGVYSGSSDLSLLGDLTKLQMPNYEVLNEQIVTRTFFGKVPLHVRVDYFKATQERMFLTLSIGTRSSALRFRRRSHGADAPDVMITTRITNEEDDLDTFTLTSPGHFAASPHNASALYNQTLVWQARLALKPGLYKASFALEDRVSGSVATHVTNLEVPDFHGSKLQMSSVILSEHLEPAPEGSEPGRTPYVLGRWRLVPKLDPEFKKNSNAAFYFQVYNALMDPVTELPSLNISYRFYKLEDGKFEPVSEAIILRGLTSQVHAYEVPLSTFPSGFYLVRIEAQDMISNTSTFREVLFKVQE